MKNKIAFTQGDTNGVGYELIFKAFETGALFEICTPVIYGHMKIARHHLSALGMNMSLNVISSPSEARENLLNFIIVDESDVNVTFGKSDAQSGLQARKALERAVEDWKNRQVDALVTAPIDKSVIPAGDVPFVGHTEYLEAATQSEGLMILFNERARVALATTHLPVSQVARALTPELLENKLKMLHHSLCRDFGLSNPRIAVLSLNPHCGDHGVIGNEDDELIVPLVKRLNSEGLPCFGPYAADGFFGQGHYTQFDAILAMYHDQGLAPLKMLDIDGGVNFTANLPFVRTSPDHGTASDIAGKGEADISAMLQAIYSAIDICRHREAYDEAHANPLEHVEYQRRETRE